MNSFGALLAAAVVLSLAPLAVAEEKAGTAAALLPSLVVPEELQISLFASAPLIGQLSSLDVDEQGRVWVLEALQLGPGASATRIAILTDSDKDGQADGVSVFYQDPTLGPHAALCVLGNRVLVSGSPHVFVLIDSNRDGKADKRQLLFTTAGGHDQNTDPSAFSFGPDGKLYFSIGAEEKELAVPGKQDCPLHGAFFGNGTTTVIDAGGNQVKASGSPYRQGMVFRCNPDGTEVETLAWNFRSASELAVDSAGTIWRTDRDPGGVRGGRIDLLLENGNYGDIDESSGRPWNVDWTRARAEAAPVLRQPYFWHQTDPGVVPDAVELTNGAPAGIVVYEGRTLPKRFWNELIVCDPTEGTIWAWQMDSVVPGVPRTNETVVSSSRPGFHPVQASVAPDGSVYVLDATTPGQPSRIYRIARKGSKPSVPPQDWSSPHGWVGALQSGNRATRYLAWSNLHAAQTNAERPLLTLSRAIDSAYKQRALQLLTRIQGSGDAYISECLQDTNAFVRILGLRAARAQRRDLLPLLGSLANDPSPIVRRECALLLHASSAPEAADLWTELALRHDPEDRWNLEALGIGADGQWDRFLETWLAKAKTSWKEPAGRQIVWRSRGQKTKSLLHELLNEPGLDENEKSGLRHALELLLEAEKASAASQAERHPTEIP